MGALLLQTTKSLARSFSSYLYSLSSCSLQQNRGLKMTSVKKARILDSDDEKQERLVWVDLEMTGLDVEKDKIIEIACIITSGNLDIIAEGPNIVIHQTKTMMDGMDDWCRQHHGQSGLTQAVLDSKISTSEAEKKVLSFVSQHTTPGTAPLAGNSVYMDKMFLQHCMPTLVNHLHYRIVDVSSVKELCRRWYPTEFCLAPQKALTHRALDDIRESIKELQYYKKAIFKSPSPPTS